MSQQIPAILMYVRDGKVLICPIQWECVGEQEAVLTLHKYHKQALFGDAGGSREPRWVSYFRRVAEKHSFPSSDDDFIHCLVKPD